MADELSAAFERLRTSTQRLNTASDAAAKLVKDVEAFLEESGVSVWGGVVVKTVPIIDESEPEYKEMWLEYCTVSSGRRRIAVVYTTYAGESDSDIVGETSRPWAESNREEKLESLRYLPALLLDLAQRIEAQANEAEQALAAVAPKVPFSQVKKGGA